VIAVAETVIYKYAMMIELLNTSVAEVAVVCILWPQVLAIDTNIVQMEFLFFQFLKQFNEILICWHVTWIEKYS
jgi:hypothetical protein